MDSEVSEQVCQLYSYLILLNSKWSHISFYVQIICKNAPTGDKSLPLKMWVLEFPNKFFN